LFFFGTNLVTVTNTNRCLLLHLYISTSREKQNQAFFRSGKLITQYEFCLSFRLAKVTFPKGQKQSQTIKKSKKFSVGGSAPHIHTQFRIVGARLHLKKEKFSNQLARASRARALF
jgi:hypothetical protein